MIRSSNEQRSRQNKQLSYGVVIIVLSGLILGVILTNSAIQQHLLRKKRGPVYQLEPGTPFIYENANINEVIQFLATKNKLQYFHNPQLKGKSYKIHGQFEENFTPMQEIDKLALQYNLQSLTFRNTLYLLTPAQFALRKDTFAETRENSKDWQSPKYIPTPEDAQEGFFITEANLNDVIQFIAKSANLNYFHNAELSSKDYIVSGQLHPYTDACKALEELILAYGLKVLRIRNTIYIFTPEQYAQRKVSIIMLLDQNQDWQPSPEKGVALDDDGFYIREANINDVIQFISESEGLSYWQNPQLQGSKYEVTGHLHSSSPALEIIEELALIHNLKALTIDDKIHLFTPQQLAAHYKKHSN
ncbi:MAG: hypothetical protein L3J39_10835 [Verrucomicrobiales bacterium]|nr:hypothetical protein [Verrucomicrobiales bacterium]